MAPDGIRRIIEGEMTRNDGLLRLRPAWVSRDFLPPGRRLGLREDQIAVGERGFICERWLGSETEAENTIHTEHEGLSFLEIEGKDLLLRDAIAACPGLLMGEEYSRAHRSLGRLAKIYDFDRRIFFHYHQTAADARKVGRNSKEEAYFYPEGVPLGIHPETFFGVHPYIVREQRQEELLLPLLQAWDSDRILMHSRAYLNVPGEGFHLPAGLLHAPGTALTIELQEPSDVMGVLQAVVDGKKVSKRLLLHHVPPEEAARKGERAALDQLLWDENGDPLFYEKHHTPPIPIPQSAAGVSAWWIYYNTTKFSGKRFVLAPGSELVDVERGVHNLLVWKGRGTAQSLEIGGGQFGLDELLVPHPRAVTGVRYRNTGAEPLEILVFFGPDINDATVPYLKTSA